MSAVEAGGCAPTVQVADSDVASALAAITRARNTAMVNTVKARVPECGKFGEIAQELDAALDVLHAALAPRSTGDSCNG